MVPPDDTHPPSMTDAELVSLLRWYVDMGIDLAIDEEAHDRFADSLAANSKSRPARQSQAAEAGPQSAPDAPLAFEPTKKPPLRNLAQVEAAAPPPPDQAAVSARELAQAAMTLDDLRAALESFDGCALKRSASRLVFADGNPLAKIMLVGEAPGADEDRQGVPFVGRAGQLLDRMLESIGLDRTSVYIANVIPWRPPGNRTPTVQETAICLPFIQRQIALCNPDILVCLGASSAQTLLNIREGIMRARGRWGDYVIDRDRPEARAIKAIAMLHPAYLLRQPAHKKFAWRDLIELRKAIGSPK